MKIVIILDSIYICLVFLWNLCFFLCLGFGVVYNILNNDNVVS